MDPRERLGIKPYDSAEYMHDEEERRLYLEACQELAGDDQTFMERARATVERSRTLAEYSRLSQEIAEPGAFEPSTLDTHPVK